MEVDSYSAQETMELGKQMGTRARPGSVYTLIGDLGAGKTVFTQGFAQGLGILEPVSSLFIILMCIGSGMWKRWRKLAARIIFMGAASAWWNGRTGSGSFCRSS